MIEFGNFSLLLAFCISLVIVVFLFIGIKREDWRYVEASCRATKAVLFFMTLAVGVLIYAFITNDFRIEYVSSFSETVFSILELTTEAVRLTSALS